MSVYTVSPNGMESWKIHERIGRHAKIGLHWFGIQVKLREAYYQLLLSLQLLTAMRQASGRFIFLQDSALLHRAEYFTS